MEKTDVLAEIRRVVDEEWASNSLPVLLSKLPRVLTGALGTDYKAVLEEKTLKAFLLENAQAAGIDLVQDSEHHARIGVVPAGETYSFPPAAASTRSARLVAADVRTFARVLDAMTPEEQRLTALPTSFIARLLAVV